ncbi:MAG: discoidin domain-containing protein, partial [Gemmatimonadaceae bacterium]
NWWNTGTPWVAVNWNFERRIALLPAGFDADGQMYVDTRFADFPRRVPPERWRSTDDLFVGWMLLSYRKPVTASSARDSFPPSPAVTDENPRTYWVAQDTRRGQWLQVDLGAARDVRAVQVNYTDYKSNLWPLPPGDTAIWTSFRIQTSLDGRTWTTAARVGETAADHRDRANAYVELPRAFRARYVRWVHGHVGAANLAVSDVRVFGTAGGPPPATPAGLTARRDRDERNMTVSWTPVPGAVGYNVRWGIAPTKLYQTYQRFHDEPIPLEIRALTVGQEYWVAIESFDENGVSGLSAPVRVQR